MVKKQKYSHQSFESTTERGKFTKICNDMMEKPAWNDLNLRQQGLYLALKSKYTQKVSYGTKISDNANNISMPKSEAQKLYGDLRTFRNDMDSLILHGFMRLVYDGFAARQANIYGFSDRWTQFGRPGFYIPENEQRWAKHKN